MTQNKAQSQIQKARQAGESGREDKAVQIYADVIQQIPPDTSDDDLKQIRLDALRERGAMLIQCNLPIAALSDFELWRDEAPLSSDSIEVFLGIARVYSRLGEYNKASDAYHRALGILEIYPDIRQQAQIYSGLATVYTSIGSLDEALDYNQKALQIYQTLADKNAQARVLSGMGISYKYLGKLDKSITAFDQSIELSREAGQLAYTAIAINNLGECYQDLFDMEAALCYHQEALTLLKKSGEDRWRHGLMCDIYRNIGIDMRSLGRTDEGIEYLRRACQFANMIKMVDVELQVLNSYAMTEFERGNLFVAKDRAQESVEKSKEMNSQGQLVIALYILGLCLQAENKVEDAEKTWQEASYLAHELKQRNVLWRIHAALAEVSMSQNMAQVHKDLAIKTLNELADSIDDEGLRQKFLSASPVQAVFYLA
jgi:tetratricopeptide (TPR) repeat protein